MNQETAERLAREIAHTPGWHAGAEINRWTGNWTVIAWQGDTDEDEENSYTLHDLADWYRLTAGLAAEKGA